MRFGFLAKLAMATLLVVAFDRLFPVAFAGARVGVFALLWTLALIVSRPMLLRHRAAWIALGAALILCIALVDQPGPLAWILFWTALSIAALMPRAGRFDDAYRWLARILLHGLSEPVGIIQDAIVVMRRPQRGGRPTLRSITGLLTVPLLGTALFVSLFAAANPVIAQVLGSVEAPAPMRFLLWAGVAAAVWPAFRPRALAVRLGVVLPDPDMRLPGTSLPSVVIALILFNAAFAVENALDIAFLWSGAPLPDGVTLADYAHNGAYPLIVTALLAGAFVLLTLRRGSATASSPLARRLVVLWVAQNLFLVASSVLRTLDYIQVYQLTALRIAALVWMALVAVGLVLICWRALCGYSAGWLINANALAAALVLIASCFVDYDATAAQWNVAHGREVGGSGAAIDLCYLRQIGAAGLLPLIELEHRRLLPQFRDRVRAVRQDSFNALAVEQGSWDHWTARNRRRLALAEAWLGKAPPKPEALTKDQYRDCDGSIQVAMPDPADLPPPPAEGNDPATANYAPPTQAELAPSSEDAARNESGTPAAPGNHEDLTADAAR